MIILKQVPNFCWALCINKIFKSCRYWDNYADGLCERYYCTVNIGSHLCPFKCDFGCQCISVLINWLISTTVFLEKFWLFLKNTLCLLNMQLLSITIQSFMIKIFLTVTVYMKKELKSHINFSIKICKYHTENQHVNNNFNYLLKVLRENSWGFFTVNLQAIKEHSMAYTKYWTFNGIYKIYKALQNCHEGSLTKYCDVL